MWSRAHRSVWLWCRRGTKRTAYYLRWYDDAGRLRSRKASDRKGEAKAMREQLELEINHGEFRETSSMRLSAFAAEHLKLMAEKVAERTLRQQQLSLDQFRAFTGDVRLSDVTHGLAEAFMSHRLAQVSKATANKDLRTLRAIFEHGIKRGYLERNPFESLQPAAEQEKDIRVLSTEEVGLLLSAAPTLTWKAFLFLALTTGLRRGELCALEWADVDFDAGTIRVRGKEGHRTKSRRNRTAILLPEAAQLLRELRVQEKARQRRKGLRKPYLFWARNGKRFGLGGGLKAFKPILEKAGIGSCTIHDLRRTFVSHLAAAGISEAVAQKLAGHASISTTVAHYTRIMPEDMRRASEVLPYRGMAGAVVQLEHKAASAG